MPYKVNYGLKRAERNRAKQEKKETKLREREAQAAARAKARETGPDSPEPGTEDDPTSA